MQNFICWSFLYESIIALNEWFFLIGGFIIEYLAPIIIASIIAYLTYGLGQATKNLVSTTKELVHVTKPKPNVICTIRRSYQNQGGIKFVIKNTGNAPAFDIKADIELYKETPTGNKDFNFDVSILAPEQGFLPRKNLEQLGELKKFHVEISWALKPKGKIKNSLEYTIDYSNLEKDGFHEAGLDQVAEEIALIKNELANKNKNH